MNSFGPSYQSTMACAHALGMSEADCTALDPIAKRFQQSLHRLAGLVKANRRHDAGHHLRKILRSNDAKVTAFVRTAKAKPDKAAPTLAQIRTRAAKLNLFHEIDEPVTVCPTAKPEGGTRYIVKFGWNRQAAQMLCADILTLYYSPAPFDYLSAGKGGKDGAIERLMQQIEKEKYPLVVTVDIRNLFGSANKEKVAAHLPLPERVTRNVLLLQDGVKVLVKPPAEDVFDPYTDEAPSNPDEAIRQGLPQGSRASGLIMYQGVLGPLLGTLSFADKLVLFGDDLAVPVKDQAEAKAVLKALEAALASSPAGLLHIGRHAIANIHHRVDFLGYRIRRKHEIWGGHLHICPSGKSFRRFRLRAKAKYREAEGGNQGLIATIRYKWSWLRSWRLWKTHWLSKMWLDLYLRMTIWPELHAEDTLKPKS